MKYNCEFFKPSDAAELALLIKKHIHEKTKIKDIDYTLNKLKFSNDFIKLIEQATVQRSFFVQKCPIITKLSADVFLFKLISFNLEQNYNIVDLYKDKVT